MARELVPWPVGPKFRTFDKHEVARVGFFVGAELALGNRVWEVDRGSASDYFLASGKDRDEAAETVAREDYSDEDQGFRLDEIETEQDLDRFG